MITLHNNIYYFPIAERPGLIQHLAGLLHPGGAILLTTACQGYISTQALNLWAQMTAGAGPLPDQPAVVDLLAQAGFTVRRTFELLPGGGFYSFFAMKS